MKKKWMLIVTVCFMILFGCQAVQADRSYFRIDGLYTGIKDNGATIGIGPYYSTDWSDYDITFTYMIYDVDHQVWTTLAENSGNWCEWQPELSGTYWIHVIGRTSGGDEVSYTLPYYVAPSTNVAARPWITVGSIYPTQKNWNEIHLSMDGTTNTDYAEYRWMYYDVEKGYWGMIQDWSVDKMTTWYPEKTGAYWIHAEARTATGEFSELTIGYQVAEYTVKLGNLRVETSDYATYYICQEVETNDPNIVRNYQIYDLQTGKWMDLNTGYDAWWKPKNSGTYWVHATVTGSDGTVYTNTIAYGIKGYRISSLGFKNPLQAGVTSDLWITGEDILHENYTFTYYQWNGSGWNQIHQSIYAGYFGWTPWVVGDYAFRCTVVNQHGVLVDEIVSYISPENFGKNGWYYEDGYKFYYINGEKQLDLDGILPRQDSYIAMINRTTCTVTIYAKDGDNGYIIPVKRFACSVGLPSTPTPTGTYRTLAKYRWHELMGPSWGQYCTRIVGGVLFHSVAGSNTTSYNLNPSDYNMLGSPASHGCVRLCVRDAKWIYDNCKLGMQVTIYDSSWPGPLGQGEVYRITDPNQNWDPTDPNV